MNFTLYLEKFFGAIDRMDAARFADYFEETGSFRFANQPPAEGRFAIQALAQNVFDQLNGIGHRVVNLGTNELQNLFVEGFVTYHRKDGKVVELPFACVFEFVRESGQAVETPSLVKRYRSYIDVAPLMS